MKKGLEAQKEVRKNSPERSRPEPFILIGKCIYPSLDGIGGRCGNLHSDRLGLGMTYAPWYSNETT